MLSTDLTQFKLFSNIHKFVINFYCIILAFNSCYSVHYSPS